MTYAPPPPVPSSAGAGQPRLRGRIPLRLAIIFLILGVAGIAAGAAIIGTQSVAKVNSFQRVSIAAQSGSVTFNGTGKWVAYYEAPNIGNNSTTVPQVNLAIQNVATKQVTRIKTLFGNRADGKIDKLTYEYGNHHGAALYQFNISKAGKYLVGVQGAPGTPAGAQIAFGRSIAKGTTIGALVLILGVVLFVIGIILLIIGLVKRSRSKKELAAAGSGTPYGGFGAPMYGQPGQQGPPGGQQPPPYGQQPGYGTPPPPQGYSPPPPPPQQPQQPWPPQDDH